MSTDYRWATVAAVVDALRACPELAGVQVEPMFPGERTARETVWIGQLTSTEMYVPASGPVPVLGQDDWSLPINVGVMVGNDFTRTTERLGALVAAVTDTIRAMPDLDDLTGDGWALLSFTLAGRDDFVVPTSAGQIAATEIRCEAETRLTSED